MSDAAKAEGAVETEAAAKAAAAHRLDAAAINAERNALLALAAAAKAAAVWTTFGGRNDMAQHLSDLSQEHNWLTLINRDQWLGFTNPQAAYSWKQLELQQAYLMNRAKFGATSSGTGYTTPDQYLAYLQREYVAERDLSNIMLARASVYKANADAYTAYANALKGHAGTVGTLSEGSLATAQSYEAALAGLPDQVTTKLTVDDAVAIARLSAYKALLESTPREISTHEALTAATAMGGTPVPAALPPEQIEISYTGPYQQQFAAILAEIAELSKMHADIPVQFDIDPAEVAALKARLGQLDVTQLVTEHLASQGGGIGGGGGPPPVTPAAAAPDPGDAEKWNQLAAAEQAAGAAADADAVKFAALQAAAAGDAEAAAKLAYAYRALGGGAAEAGAATAAASAKTDQAGGAFQAIVPLVAKAGTGWGAWNAQLNVFAGQRMPGVLGLLTIFGTSVGVLHIAFDAIIEVLAILIPSIVTLAAGLAAFILVGNLAQDTLGRISDRLKATYTAATATGQAIYPVTNAFDSLAKVIRPQIWQLYGDALTVASGKVGIIGQLATQTGAVLDRLAARFTVWADQASKGLNAFFTVGASDLAQLSKVLANLGNAFMNLIRVTQDTHVDQIFLAALIVVSQLIELLTKLPTPLLAAVIGLHAFWLWGGLLATMLTNLLAPIRAASVAMGGLEAESTALGGLGAKASGFDKLKAAMADIGAGAAALPARLGLVSKASDEAAVSAGAAAITMDEEAAAMSGEAVAADAAAASTGLFGTALKGLAAIFSVTNLVVAAAVAVGVYVYKVVTARDATQQWIDSMNKGLGSSSLFTVIGKTVSDLAAVTQQLSNAQGLNAQATHELTGAQSQLSGQLSQELTHVGDISKAYGVDMPGALALLNTAGVKTSDLFTTQAKVWAADEQQVAGLVKGYAAMGQGLTQLQGDVSVQLVTGADQLKQMQQLNQAWDTWLTTVTGGETAFVSFQQNLATTNTSAAAAGASMGGLNAQSLTLRSSYLQMIPAAGTVLDNIRQQSAVLQNGAQGTAILTKATKDLAAEMMPLAAGNKAAQDSLLALVQEADPSITTWQKLTQWVGPLGVSGAAADLNTIMTKLETPVSNLAADAQKLTTSLQQDLNPAMAQAEFNALGGQKAFDTFATDLAKFGPGSQVTIEAGKTVAQMLLSIDKNSSTAKDQFVAWAESMGLSQKQADQLWASVSKGVAPLAATRQGLAQSATASDNLSKSGFFAWARDRYAQNLGEIATWFGTTLPHAMSNVGTFAARVWTDSFQGFMRGFGSPVARWFTASLPDFFTQTVPHAASTAWDTVYQNFMRGFGSPLAKFFTVSVPGFFKGIWKDFQTDFGDPIGRFVTQSIPGFFTGIGKSIGQTFTNWYHSWNGNFVNLVGTFFLDLIPGWLTGTNKSWLGSVRKQGSDFSANVIAPIGRWFAGWPGALDQMGKQWLSHAHQLWSDFVTVVLDNMQHFFGSTVPSWFTGMGKDWLNHAHQMWSDFVTVVLDNLQHFFGTTVPNWFKDMGSRWLTNVIGLWHSFNGNVVTNVEHFFTSSIPSWFSSMGSKWLANVKTMWSDLVSHVVNPMGNWLSTTMPNAVKTAFHDSIKWVVDHVINAVISFIDNNVLNHLPGSLHINTISYSAAGGDIGPARKYAAGSVPGTGDTDGTHILAMGGEYMLRKPARMALEAVYGRGFMDHLNQADSWLGAGSRGTPASQQRRPGINYAAGGFVNPIGLNLAPERIDMGVDYGGTGPLFALGSGIITSLFNSGWPGGGFIGLHLDQTPGGGVPWWYYAEDVSPFKIGVGSRVTAGQYIAEATGGSSGIEVGYAAPPGTGNTMAAATGESAAGQRQGDPGAFATGWGVAASNLIASLGGRPGLRNGQVQGGTPGISGGLGAIWQTVEGLLDAAGSGLGSLVRPLAGLVSGGAAELLKLARQGAASIFGAVWDHSVKPLANLIPGDTIPGALAQGSAAEIRQGIINFLTGQDSTAQSSAASSGFGGGVIGPVSGPADAGPGQAEAYAQSRLGSYGWDVTTQFPSLQRLWNQESGWNRFAKNPSSGAYGIPQSLPESKLPFAGQEGGGSHASPQVDWGLGYIQGRYGSPVAAWGHELVNNWYPFGGVIGEYASGGTAADSPLPPNYPAKWVALGGGPGLISSMWTEEAAFWQLMADQLPRTATPQQASAFRAWKVAMQNQQIKTIGMGRNPPGDFMVLSGGLAGDPSTLTQGQWNNFTNDLGTLVRWQEGIGIPGGQNPAGTPPDSGWPAWNYAHGDWTTLMHDMWGLQNTARDDYQAWYYTYGPGQFPQTPGVAIQGVVNPAGLSVDLSGVATMGGPLSPVFGANPVPDMGFSIVPGKAAGGSIADVAAMFSPGAMLPVVHPGGIPSALLHQLSVAGGQPDHPRRLSAAGSATSSIGLNVETMNIHNPAAEQPSQSITRASNRLAFLAGRGVA